MPELPEVETVKRIIEPQILGHKIFGVDVCNRQVIAYPTPDKFVEILLGRVFVSMSRRGKFLSFHFDNGDELVLHLRMTGQLLVTPEDYPQEKHTHVRIYLEDDRQIRYIDVRRFGRFWYLTKEEADTMTGRSKLGPEPFDAALTAEYLQTKLGAKKKAIKEMLHDQSVVAGIGNIYSDEILFASHIYPETRCCELTDADWQMLSEKIPEILEWGIQTNAMSPEEYLAGKGKEYRNTPDLRVYGREGKPCVNCSTSLRRITVGGRSSCFCPVCQKKVFKD